MKEIPIYKKNQKIVEREVDILSQMNHENVIKAVDIKQTRDKIEIMMEYCEHTLSDYIKESIFPLSLETVF